MRHTRCQLNSRPLTKNRWFPLTESLIALTWAVATSRTSTHLQFMVGGTFPSFPAVTSRQICAFDSFRLDRVTSCSHGPKTIGGWMVMISKCGFLVSTNSHAAFSAKVLLARYPVTWVLVVCASSHVIGFQSFSTHQHYNRQRFSNPCRLFLAMRP
jgi:hypothetical protein